MACNCERCIHYEACDFHFDLKEYPPSKCDLFKDKSRFVVLPYGMGEITKMELEMICYEKLGLNYATEKLKEWNIK